ncbi:hypothetical protein CDL15_Pgr011696 [Punica granatum]|uniref:Uncharacterized protein n=1 Tax=Punica granatum TaxID=22663 RepID=A0A218WXN2_PUNGR|nr:hypothetical protein CDL15_Pgr011696 [Punica granatum]
MPPPCDKGFYFAGCLVLRDSSSGVERLRILSGRESESAVALACLWYLWIPFSEAQMQGLCGVPVSYVWAYRDVPDDALAALSVVRRARRL